MRVDVEEVADAAQLHLGDRQFLARTGDERLVLLYAPRSPRFPYGASTMRARALLALVLVAGCGGAEAPKMAGPLEPVTPPVLPSSSAVVPVYPVPTSTASASPPPKAPKGTTPRIVQLSPSDASCGLDAEGRVWTFVVGKMEPEVPSLRGARSIACGMNHSCVLGADAKVYCWGNNAYGALGDGTEKDRTEPVPVVGLSQVAELAVDYARTCVRTISGDVYCWGDSEFGKAGDGRLPDNVGREKTTPGKPDRKSVV